jgi:hypothetical protein
MTFEVCYRYVPYLTKSELRYFAAMGLNEGLNAMRTEDAEAQMAAFKKRRNMAIQKRHAAKKEYLRIQQLERGQAPAD